MPVAPNLIRVIKPDAPTAVMLGFTLSGTTLSAYNIAADGSQIGLRSQTTLGFTPITGGSLWGLKTCLVHDMIGATGPVLAWYEFGLDIIALWDIDENSVVTVSAIPPGFSGLSESGTRLCPNAGDGYLYWIAEEAVLPPRDLSFRRTDADGNVSEQWTGARTGASLQKMYDAEGLWLIDPDVLVEWDGTEVAKTYVSESPERSREYPLPIILTDEPSGSGCVGANVFSPQNDIMVRFRSQNTVPEVVFDEISTGFDAGGDANVGVNKAKTVTSHYSRPAGQVLTMRDTNTVPSFGSTSAVLDFTSHSPWPDAVHLLDWSPVLS